MGILGRIQKSIPVYMDYQGQKLSEKLFQAVILIAGVIGFAWGYYVQQLSHTVYILAAGFLLSCFLVLIPWPLYRRHSLKWLKPTNTEANSKSDEPTTQTKSKPKRKAKAS